MSDLQNLSKKAIVIGLIIGGLSVYLLGQLLSNDRLSTTRSVIDEELQAQAARLLGLSTLLRHGGGTTHIDSIVTDCAPADRSRFDGLLGRIESLNRVELADLRTLFYVCADYHAKRRTGVFFQFEREVEIWRQLVTVRRSLGSFPADLTDNWFEALEYERTRMNVLNSLVRIQGDIIEALYEGEARESERLRSLLDESLELRQQLVPRGL